MHTDSTLSWLEQCTTTLGRQLRRFQSYTCSFFQTRELPKEAAARGRRKAKKKPTSNQKDKTLAVASSSSKVSKLKVFNLVTFKLHALGDYVRTIRWFGTSDSYSTQPVRCLKNMNISWQLIELKLEKGELEHRRVKKFYARTNKNAAIRQITRLERREDALRRIQQILRTAAVGSKEMEDPKDVLGQPQTLPGSTRVTQVQRKIARKSAKTTLKPYLTFTESEALPYTPPALHHHISDSRNFPANITSFLASFQGDLAIYVCFEISTSIMRLCTNYSLW